MLMVTRPQGASAWVISRSSIDLRASSASAAARVKIETRQQQGEFFAAIAGDQHRLFQRDERQGLADRAQAGVAGDVAVTVVVELEMIDIDHHQRDRLAAIRPRSARRARARGRSRGGWQARSGRRGLPAPRGADWRCAVPPRARRACAPCRRRRRPAARIPRPSVLGSRAHARSPRPNRATVRTSERIGRTISCSPPNQVTMRTKMPITTSCR